MSPPPAAETVTTVSDGSTAESSGKAAATVISVGSPPSFTASGEAVRVISAGAASLSVIVIAAPSTVLKPEVSAAPETARVSSPSAVLSSVTVRVKVASPLVSPAGMVMSKVSTGV